MRPLLFSVRLTELGSAVVVPATHLPAYKELAAHVLKHNAGWAMVKIYPPERPRKTGYRSGSARLHGHCQDLAIQLVDKTGAQIYSSDQIKAAMKRMAVGDGMWRTLLDIDGTEQPISEANASMEEETAINRILQRFADEHGLWLTEYDDTVKPPVPYRSVGGRSRKEMMRLAEEGYAE